MKKISVGIRSFNEERFIARLLVDLFGLSGQPPRLAAA